MENKDKKQTTKTTTIRISEKLCNQIDIIAKENKRTRNKQIEYMLTTYIETMKKF